MLLFPNEDAVLERKLRNNGLVANEGNLQMKVEKNDDIVVAGLEEGVFDVTANEIMKKYRCEKLKTGNLNRMSTLSPLEDVYRKPFLWH